MKREINPKLERGDRVMILHMDGETGVPPGTMGTVENVTRDPFEFQNDGEIIQVKWDNGSNLSIVSATDAWKKMPKENIEEQRVADSKFEFFKKNPDIFDYFDWRWFRDYLKLIQKSGIVNMFEAHPLLYSGKEHIDRYYGEGKEDDEDFQKVLDSADTAKDKIIQGILNYIQDKDLDLDDMDKINSLAKRFSKSLLGAYIQFYI